MSSVTFNKLQKRIRRLTASAIIDYQMIEDGDKVMVCLSGGKDSYTLLDMLLALQKVAPVHFSILAVNLDQKQPGFDERVLPNYLTQLGVDFQIIEEDTYSIVKDKVPEGKTMCSLCSRLRRGILYSFAKQHGVSKIALGHHKQDILETFFLNLFFAGQLKAMPAKLRSDDGEHTVIRPLAYVDEADIIKFSQHKAFPILPCNLCGSQENLQRQNIKQMIADWEKQYPHRSSIMFNALQNTTPSHLLDRERYDFLGFSSSVTGVLPTEATAENTMSGDKRWLIPEKSTDDASEDLPEAAHSRTNYASGQEKPLIFYPRQAISEAN